MKRALLWMLSAVGFAVVLWLLLAAPGIPATATECQSILGSTGSAPVHGEVSDGAVRMCMTGQTKRLGWALLVALPTLVLAAAAVARRGPAR